MPTFRDIAQKSLRAARDAWDSVLAMFAAKDKPQPPERLRRTPLRMEQALSPRRRGGEPIKDKLTRAWRVLERSTGVTVGFVVIFVLAAGWAAATRWTGIAVEDVVIARTDPLVDVDLATQSLGDLTDISYFWVPEAAIVKAVREAQPNVADVSFDRSFPNGLTVTLRSHPAAFVIRENDKEGVVTSNGVLVLRPAPRQGLPELRVVRAADGVRAQAFNYRRILDPQDADKTVALAAALADKLPNVPLLRMTFFPMERELHAEMGTGRTVLLFDADADFGKPLQKLRFYASKKGDPFAKNAWFYADLRVPNKIFSCPVEKTRDCRKNLVGIFGHAYDYVVPGAKAGTGATIH